jgi:lipopolysaccharide transport system permease protein
MIPQIAEFLRARNLLREWIARTLQARYQQSLLGWLWAFVQPASQAIILTVVFTLMVPVDTGGTPYVAFAYLATMSWALLAGSLTDMTTSLVDNMNLVNKIYFPREVLPIAAMLARLVDFAIAGALFLAIAWYLAIPVFLPGLLMLPVVVLVQMALVLGIGLTAAALNVFVRDVRSVLLLVTQLWFYASPVIYPVQAVPETYRALYSLNPMVGIIEAYRDLLLRARWPDASLGTAALISTLLCVFGYTLFKRVEFRFADVV